MTDILYLEDVADDYEAELELGDEADPEIIEAIEDFMSEIGASDLDELRYMANDDSGLIADWYFEQYARELADSIGAVDANAGWPTYFIDWKAAAEALQMDYIGVEYGGHTYWMGG